MKTITTNRYPACFPSLPESKHTQSPPRHQGSSWRARKTWISLSSFLLCAGLSAATAVDYCQNPGVEVGNGSPWTSSGSWGGSTVGSAAVGTAANPTHTGLQMWKTAGDPTKPTGTQTPMQIITGMPPGGTTYCGMWVRIPAASPATPINARLRLWFGTGAGSYVSGYYGPYVTFTDSNWTFVDDGTGGVGNTPNATCTSLEMRLYVENAGSLDVYIDDAFAVQATSHNFIVNPQFTNPPGPGTITVPAFNGTIVPPWSQWNADGGTVDMPTVGGVTPPGRAFFDVGGSTTYTHNIAQNSMGYILDPTGTVPYHVKAWFYVPSDTAAFPGYPSGVNIPAGREPRAHISINCAPPAGTTYPADAVRPLWWTNIPTSVVTADTWQKIEFNWTNTAGARWQNYMSFNLYTASNGQTAGTVMSESGVFFADTEFSTTQVRNDLVGWVVSQLGAPVAGATVVLSSAYHTGIATNITAADGSYSFPTWVTFGNTFSVNASIGGATSDGPKSLTVSAGNHRFPNVTLTLPTGTISGKVYEVVAGVTNGYPGVVVHATAGSTVIDSLVTGADGNYSLTVSYNIPYTLSVSGLPLGKIATSIPGPITVPDSTPVTGQNIRVANDPDYDPTALVSIKASYLTVGTNLATWQNRGSLGGSFDKYTGGLGPNVKYVLGKKAVEFVQASGGAADRRTLASATPTPASITGNNPWTISTLLYRNDSSVNSENCYFEWSGRSWNNGQTAQFSYRNNLAFVHFGGGTFDSGFTAVPSAGAWHYVTITYDGTVETIYVDGAVDKTITRTPGVDTLDLYANGLMIIGGATWHDVRAEDQYWRFNGAIASMKIYDKALTATEVAALVTTTKHTITVTSGSNGSVTPGPGPVSIDEGDSPTFAITPNLGYRIVDVLVDGVSNPGAIATGSYTFDNVLTDHTIAATFGALPPQVVSGKVTDGTNGVMGAKVYFKLSPTAYSTPLFTTTTTNAAGNYAISLPPATYYVAAGADGYDYTADKVITVSSAPVTVPNFVLVANPNWDVLFSMTVDGLAGKTTGDPTGNRPTVYPTGGMLNMIATPTVVDVDGLNWESNDRDDTVGNDGYELASVSFLNGTPANGVSAVVVVQPRATYIGGEARGEVVNLYYNGLSLAIDHATLEVMVARKAWNWMRTGVIIPEGQKTILSLVCQLDGSAKLFVNGSEEWTGDALGDGYYAFLQGTDMAWMNRIGVGRNPWDGWSAYNGNIGDVYVYKTAIPIAKRKAMETALSVKFGITIGATTYNWAGPNNGAWSNPANWNNTVPGVGNTAVFSDTATAGATIDLDASVEVKGVTFNNLVANQNITSTLGSTLALMNGAALSTLQTEAGAHTISAAVDAGMGIAKTGAGKLTLSGTVAIGNSSTINPVLSISGTGSELVLAGPTAVAFTKSTHVKAGGKLTITSLLTTQDADQIIGTGIGSAEVVLSGTGTWTHAGRGVFQIGNDAVGCVGTLTVKDSAVLDTTAPITIGVGWGGGCTGFLNQTGGTIYDRSEAGTGFGWAVGDGSSAIYNLDGGAIETAQLWGDGRGMNVLNMNGGTIRASSNLYPTNFITDITHAYVKAGGAIIDDNGYAVAINQVLEHGGDAALDGGLTKLGLGALTMNKACTYTGPTKVQVGILSCLIPASLAATDVEIASGATLDLAYTGTRTVTSLKIAGSYKGPGVYSSTTSGITGTGTVTVGAPGLPLSGMTMPGGMPTFAIEKTAVGSTYRLVYKNNITDSTWTPIGAGVAGNNGTLSLSDTTIPRPAQRFYRLEVR